MPTAMTSTSISCVNDPLSAATADLLVVPWFDDPSSAVPGLDAATGGEIARALTSREFQGKPFDILVTPFTDRQWRARRVALIGAGRSEDCGGELIRKLAAAAGLAARQKRVGSVAFVIRGRGDVAELAQAASEGLTL
jgi:leucyl aminopeptidase